MIRRSLVAAVLAAGAVPASAQAPWAGAGPMLAAYYNEAMSIPKGWKLTYSGKDKGVEVFVFDSDFDQYPMTAVTAPDTQLRRLLCGDDTLKGWVAQGLRARADQRARRNGKVEFRKGTTILSSC